MADDVVQSRPTVYVIQEVMRRDGSGNLVRVHNLKPALEFGNLVFVLDNRRFPITTAPLVAELKEKLAGYMDRDFILPVGDPDYIGVVYTIAAERTGGKLRTLKWDKPTQRYLERFWDLGG
jgi:hypothetical protein